MSSNLNIMNISGGYENLQATTPFIISFSLACKLIHSSLYPHFFLLLQRVQGTSSKQNYKEKGKLKGVKKKKKHTLIYNEVDPNFL